MRIVRRTIERVKSVVPFDWMYGRKFKKVIASHDEVGRQWDTIISKYQEGEIEHRTYNPKQDLGTEKIIWQYWGQGVNKGSLPEIVKICFDSADKYAGDYKVIRLSDDTISEYLDIPKEILDKRDSGQMKRPFFSDLLRVMLLTTYGGVWLDATVLMTGAFPSEYTKGDHFCFQRDHNEPHQNVWEKGCIYYYGWRDGFQVNMLNSILWAKKGSKMMQTLSDLLIYYWQNHNTAKQYFFFQILYNRLVNGIYKHLKPTVVSDCIPHYLQAVIGDTTLPYNYDNTLSKYHLHKLTYFSKRVIAKLKKGMATIY